MSEEFLSSYTFSCNVDQRLLLNPRTGKPGLPVTEHPVMLLGSNITLKFMFYSGGALLNILRVGASTHGGEDVRLASASGLQ